MIRLNFSISNFGMAKLAGMMFCTLFLISPLYCHANPTSSFEAAKNAGDDHVYYDHRMTLYCGCNYISKNDEAGAGKVDAEACNLTPLPKKYKENAKRIEWEHIVPASLTPARYFSCWKEPEMIEKCRSLRGRQCCEKINPIAQGMLFDLHNLAPTVGQINKYRLNDRYGEVEDDSEYVTWPNCGLRDENGTTQRTGMFEPLDCVKGDVARVWLYMQDTHQVIIPDEELEMFRRWSEIDPVSPWEQLREKRINKIQGNNNPHVADAVANQEGSCQWEKLLPDEE